MRGHVASASFPQMHTENLFDFAHACPPTAGQLANVQANDDARQELY
jgi:hypothetical protein